MMRNNVDNYYIDFYFIIPAKKAKVGKAGPILEKITLYVEKDPHKLVNYVCGSNIYNDGEDIKVNEAILCSFDIFEFINFFFFFHYRSNQTLNIRIGYGTFMSVHRKN